MTYFAVRNGAGLITCVTDDQRVHAALWLTRADAQDHADRMLEIQYRKIRVSVATTPTTFEIVEVDIPVADVSLSPPSSGNEDEE